MEIKFTKSNKILNVYKGYKTLIYEKKQQEPR